MIFIVCMTLGFTPPVVGMPEEFNGAVGVFTVETAADKKSVAIEESLRFTIRIRLTGEKALTPPRRPNLTRDKLFSADFYLEEPTPKEHRPDAKTWEFHYTLKPKRKDVEEIPDVKFVYFNPAFGQSSEGYQSTYSDPISITVTRRKPKPKTVIRLDKPDSFFQFPKGDLRSRVEPWHPPSWKWMLVLILSPPLFCLLWFVVWQRLYPDAARLASRRRSQATKQALKSLHNQSLHEVIVELLRAKLSFAGSHLTPVEAYDFLKQRQIDPDLCHRCEDLLRRSEAIRYGGAATGDNLLTLARQWILDLEAECRRFSS